MPSNKGDFVRLYDEDPDAWRDYLSLLLNKKLTSANPQPSTVEKFSQQMVDKRVELRRHSM